jgi:hypothetical protein
MKYNPTKFNGYSRPDLICWVLNHCVEIPPEKMDKLHLMREWCQHLLDEPRGGNILFEALEGYIDYFDGEWEDFVNELDNSQYLFWFDKKQHRTLFTLTWL